MSPKVRRQAIIEATIRVVQQKGFAGATVRDVAEVLGSSSGLIHHYFNSFDDLLAAAFKQAAADDLKWLQQLVERGEAPLAQLYRLIDNYIPPQSEWLFQFWLEAWSEAARRPELQKTSRRLNLAWQREFARVIATGVSSGVFHCPDVHASAWRLLSLLDGLAIQVVAHRALVTRKQMTDWTLRAAELELGLPAGALVTLNDAP